MCPASESRLLEVSRQFHPFGAAGFTSIMQQPDYECSSRMAVEELTEASKNYTQAVFNKACYQNHDDVRYVFQDRRNSAEYIYGQEQQAFVASPEDGATVQNSNYNVYSFGRRCTQEERFVCFSPVHQEHNQQGDGYDLCYRNEIQQNQIYDTDMYRTIGRFGHDTIHTNLSLLQNAHYGASPHADTNNEDIHSVSIRPNDEGFSESIANMDEDSGNVVKKSGSVARRNARERKRIKNVNMAFDSLRKRVPQGSKGNKISKVETLRSAIEYIRALQELVTEKKSGQQPDSDAGLMNNSQIIASRQNEGVDKPSDHLEI